MKELGARVDVELLEVAEFEPDLFAYLPPRSLLEGFARLHRSADNIPGAAIAAPMQKHASDAISNEDARPRHNEGSAPDRPPEFAQVFHGCRAHDLAPLFRSSLKK